MFGSSSISCFSPFPFVAWRERLLRTILLSMPDNINNLYESLSKELENVKTSGERLDQIASEHIVHNFDCELCEYFNENDDMISTKIARHDNCQEKTLDKLIEWGDGRGDPAWEVDILLAACHRSNFSGKWLDHVLDTAWVYRLQFERNLHYHFIRNLMDSRQISEEEKNRIIESNEMKFNNQVFPTRQDLDDMGL